MTANEKYMAELKALIGRFMTPTLVIDGEALIGFSANMSRVRELLHQGGYLGDD